MCKLQQENLKRSVGIPTCKSEVDVETDGKILVYGGTRGITLHSLHPTIQNLRIDSYYLTSKQKPDITEEEQTRENVCLRGLKWPRNKMAHIQTRCEIMGWSQLLRERITGGLL
jgi:hypothetical protein